MIISIGIYLSTEWICSYQRRLVGSETGGHKTKKLQSQTYQLSRLTYLYIHVKSILLFFEQNDLITLLSKSGIYCMYFWLAFAAQSMILSFYYFNLLKEPLHVAVVTGNVKNIVRDVSRFGYIV